MPVALGINLTLVACLEQVTETLFRAPDSEADALCSLPSVNGNLSWRFLPILQNLAQSYFPGTEIINVALKL